MRILVTGTAGFIGNALALRLLERGDEVIGVDNVNDYYDVRLKHARLARLLPFKTFTDIRADIVDRPAMARLFAEYKPQRVVNLAAQAGVRYSIEHPETYIDTNVVGFGNILEGCRHNGVEHLVYASSSSVYGANTKLPFSVHDNVDHPMSLYAATKKANELMAHTYSSLFGLPTTGLRFFTVYGPWGRPDMALFKFTRSILASEPIDVFNHGNHKRDFTYIDDIVEGIVRLLALPAMPDKGWQSETPMVGRSYAPYRIYNIGNGKPVELMRYIEVLERCLGKTAKLNLLPLQAGDVPDTCADVEALVVDANYRPTVSVDVGVKRFVDWYLEYHGVMAA
ncbi:MAG: NAD-dependent epimerase [Betaproteobacteria bacterium]|nr:NAD-dependent epimerase [Betaproteobacteria bacterium]